MFLIMLQYLISDFEPPLSKRIQIDTEAMLSTNEEYDNEQVTEFESTKERQRIPEYNLHLFMDELTDGQQIFPFERYNASYEFEFTFKQRVIDE